MEHPQSRRPERKREYFGGQTQDLGAKKFRRPMRAARPQIKKELVTKVLGLENHTFDIGNVKCASKY
jgi:hypothetical protein